MSANVPSREPLGHRRSADPHAAFSPFSPTHDEETRRSRPEVVRAPPTSLTLPFWFKPQKGGLQGVIRFLPLRSFAILVFPASSAPFKSVADPEIFFLGFVALPFSYTRGFTDLLQSLNRSRRTSSLVLFFAPGSHCDQLESDSFASNVYPSCLICLERSPKHGARNAHPSVQLCRSPHRLPRVSPL